jgi:hypothetical protein
MRRKKIPVTDGRGNALPPIDAHSERLKTDGSKFTNGAKTIGAD